MIKREPTIVRSHFTRPYGSHANLSTPSILFSIAYRYRNFVDTGREERGNWGGGE